MTEPPDPQGERGPISDDRLGRLIDAGMSLASELSLPAVLQRIVDLAAELTGARYGALGVLEEGLLTEFHTTGITAEQRSAIGALPVGHGLLGEIIQQPYPLRIPEIAEHPHSSGFPPNHPPMHSFLGAPVTARGEVFGNIYLTDKKGASAFTDEDERTVVVLAVQAGIAIDNARLYEEATHARGELERLAVMEDRERIARDLHDGAIQSLFAVGMGLQGAAQLSGEAGTQERLELAVGEIDRVIRDLRNYIFGLRPGILADRQLAQALQDLTKDFQAKSGVTTVTSINADVAAELASRAADIVHFTREALSNVGRHADATTCRVSLWRRGHEAVLEIDDDGSGFDQSALREDGTDGGSGLRNLADRAEGLGGRANVTAVLGEGTTVAVALPL